MSILYYELLFILWIILRNSQNQNHAMNRIQALFDFIPKVLILNLTRFIDEGTFMFGASKISPAFLWELPLPFLLRGSPPDSILLHILPPVKIIIY